VAKRPAGGRSPRPALLLVLVWLALAGRAQAHGIGTPQLLNAAAGPYLLSAWTDPDPLRANETHVVVAVSDPQTREPIVYDVEVTVTLTSLTDPTVSASAVAGVDSVNQLLYAAEFNDQLTPGRWRATVNVAGGRGASDPVSFELEIEPARRVNWLWIGAGGMAALVALWALASARDGRQPRRQATTRRPLPPPHT
jgi:hypothetical protein